jgi:hypothetical protein
MPDAIFCLPYFGPVSYYAALVRYGSIWLEASENYQKQTYRNRQYIYGANGNLMLNIPVKRSSDHNRLTYMKSQIENEFDWQLLHFKSLETAYRTSPYFEYYEADIEPLFVKKYESLFQFNLKCFQTVNELLGIELNIGQTKNYQQTYEDLDDHRHLIIAKSKKYDVKKNYHQVFENKHGFIPDLSILDVLFNVGPESVKYLKSIDLSQP